MVQNQLPNSSSVRVSVSLPLSATVPNRPDKMEGYEFYEHDDKLMNADQAQQSQSGAL